MNLAFSTLTREIGMYDCVGYAEDLTTIVNPTEWIRRWPDFKVDEVKCHGHGKDGYGACCVDDNLLDMLEELRRKLNTPLIISSGFRCISHNQEVGGAPDSRHIFGEAVDLFNVRPWLRAQLVHEAHHIAFRGFGFYRSHIHLDIRAEAPAYWSDGVHGLTEWGFMQ